MRISFYDSLIRPITELMGIVVIGVAILSGAYLVLNQETHLFGLRISDQPLSATQVFTLFAMIAGIADPARKLSDIYNVLVRAVMGSESLFSTFEEPPRIAAPADPVRAPLHAKSIRFENVTFGYHPDFPVINGVSFEIPNSLKRHFVQIEIPNGYEYV